MGELLKVKAINKQYGAVQALKKVDLAVEEGEVLALCGDNGAGKSTLIRIISGAERPSDGEMYLFGQQVKFASPADALVKGVATIYQDLALAPRLLVYQNVFMGSEHHQKPAPALYQGPGQKDHEGGLGPIPLPAQGGNQGFGGSGGGSLRGAAPGRGHQPGPALERQAGDHGPSPRPLWGSRRTAQVLDLIHQLHGQGVTVVIISHNMEHVLEVAQRVAILKQGGQGGGVSDRRV